MPCSGIIGLSDHQAGRQWVYFYSLRYELMEDRRTDLAVSRETCYSLAVKIIRALTSTAIGIFNDSALLLLQFASDQIFFSCSILSFSNFGLRDTFSLRPSTVSQTAIAVLVSRGFLVKFHPVFVIENKQVGVSKILHFLPIVSYTSLVPLGITFVVDSCHN